MRYFQQKTTQGFTIVELLIVIVVIGILVTIATATASSIQQRALNASYLATYKEVHKTLLGKLVANGYSAYTPSGEQFCIGKTTDFTNDGIGDCDSYQPDGSPPQYDLTHQSTTLDAAMAKFTPNMPGKLSQPFKLHVSDQYGSGTTTIYNTILHGYSDVPPAQDPQGEMRISTTQQKVAYLFGGPLYGNNQNCGANSVDIDYANIYQDSGGREITPLVPSRNSPGLSVDGMSYCLYAVIAP